MASTIALPDKASIGAYATEVASNQVAQTGQREARLANAVYDLAAAAITDIEALQAGTSIADATTGAKGIVRLAGDLAGTGTAAATPRVSGVNSATVPAGGALTTGNVLKVSGASALSYGPVNLAGGSDHVTGVVPYANLPIQVGTVTLSGGTVTLAAGISITASSKVFVSLNTPGGTLGANYSVPDASLAVGGGGVGTFVVNAVDSAGALVNTDTSTLNYLIVR